MPDAKIDKELLLAVARNARLNLTDVEIKKFLPQLQEIISAFSRLDEVKLADEKPSFQPLEVKNVMRDDAVEKSLAQEEALANSTHKEGAYFKGPKVL